MTSTNSHQANSLARPMREARAELLSIIFGQLLAWRAERLAGTKGHVDADPPAGPGGARANALIASPPYELEK